MEKCGCGRLIRVLCFFLRVVVGVSCSVVGPKRYERWGVVKTSQRRCLIRNRLSHLGMRMFLLLLGSSTVCAERGGQETGDRVKVLLQHGRRPRPGTTHGALRTVGSPWKQLL